MAEPHPARPTAATNPSRPPDRLRELFENHFEFIWRLLRRSGLSSDRADDAAQEVFIVASEKLEQISFGSERSFLFGTALRIASTVRRSAAYRREHVGSEDDARLNDAPPSSRPSSDDLLDQLRARTALDAILQTMDEDLRIVFVLYELEGVPTAEIAEMLSIPSGTAASRLRRARESFQAKVDARYPKRLRTP